MAKVKTTILSPEEIQHIHASSLRILESTGVAIYHQMVLDSLAEAGAQVDFNKKIVRFKADLVMWALEKASKRFILNGRDLQKVARFGYGDQNLISSPGQFAWFDHHSGVRRDPLLRDLIDATKVGDALSNITIVGAMAVPVDVPLACRDVISTAELVKATGKPTRCWPVTRQSSRYVLEIYAALAGGKAALKAAPMVEIFLEPISPLQLPETGLDAMLEFLDYGQPVSVGPMVMASATGPVTLAGTLAQENAEILAGITTVQVLAPGNPVIYGGIPHIMDPRTSVCAFGSPEQGLMGVAMAQMGQHYDLPVYINVNLTDAKILDVQAGMEKMGSFVLGILSGADLFGHCGIVGSDHGASLAWLVMDNEAMHYARRVLRGFSVSDDTLAESVIAEIGPAGNFLAAEHTARNFRKELWLPSKLWARDDYESWLDGGGVGMPDRAIAKVDQILADHQVEPLDPGLEKEIARITKIAQQELVVHA
jgi:trimethylamine--corrinoid protein Co-methyltransferase